MSLKKISFTFLCNCSIITSAKKIQMSQQQAVLLGRMQNSAVK